MLTSSDLAQMVADLAEVRGDNALSVALRRGATTLAAQSVRVARIARAPQAVGSQVSASVMSVVVLGPVDMNVQVGDRFTADGIVYEVTAVRPNQRSATMAEARAVQ